MLKDQIDLLSAFNAHGVEYVVVDGHAVNTYTQPRSTKDLDVFVRGSQAFEDAWKDALPGMVEGVPVRFLSREHLIANKRTVGRPRDLGDVDELRKFSRKP